MKLQTPWKGMEWYALCSDNSTEPLSIFYLSREQAQTALEHRRHDDPGAYVAKVRWKAGH